MKKLSATILMMACNAIVIPLSIIGGLAIAVLAAIELILYLPAYLVCACVHDCYVTYAKPYYNKNTHTCDTQATTSKDVSINEHKEETK